MDQPTETSGTERPSAIWPPFQAYLMAAICLAIGFAIGFFLRGSAPPKATSSTVSAASTSPAPSTGAPTAAGSRPTLDDMKRMAEKQAQPLLTELQKNPNDATLLNKTALTYKAAHQFDKAAEYFKKSLEIDPKNIAVRADYASCLYYTGDVDGAIAQLQKSLTYDPKHVGTLYNLGLIEWKGKGDPDAAVAAWQKLLKLNPDYPQKDRVERMIDAARQSKAAAGQTGNPS